MVEDMARFFPGVPSSVGAAKERMTWPSGDLAIVGLAINTFGCFSSSWRVLEERVVGAALETLMATHPSWNCEHAKSHATMVWRQHVGVGFAHASGLARDPYHICGPAKCEQRPLRESMRFRNM